MNLMILCNLSLFMLAAILPIGKSRARNNKKWRYSVLTSHLTCNSMYVGGKIKAFGHLSKGFVRSYKVSKYV